jgi:hypothetical protein
MRHPRRFTGRPASVVRAALRRATRVAATAGVLAAAAWACAAPARAQGAWPAPARDSLRMWAAEARTRFQAAVGDSAAGPNYRAYEIVGHMGRRLMKALGPGRLSLASELNPMLDSLGLDTDIRVDPEQPTFALLMVRNPGRFTAEAVGYLYWWYRDEDLRMQGVVFKGGMDPRSRVWWTGKQDRPYEWAIADEERGQGTTHFTLFRLNGVGSAWSIAQSDLEDHVLGERGEVAFTDLDRDGTPEMVQWTIPKTDSLFEPCPDCPRLMVEKTWVERNRGFTLFDSRVLPSPYATFVTFIRFLLDNHKSEAMKLAGDPSLVTSALSAGWGVSRKPGTWRIEYGEQGERWPTWLEMRFAGPQGVKRYIVHFGQRDGHWIVQSWVEPQPVKRPGVGPVEHGPAPRPPGANKP